jgi:ribosomal protein L40E
MSEAPIVRSGDGTVQILCPACHLLNPERAVKCERCGYCLRCEG